MTDEPNTLPEGAVTNVSEGQVVRVTRVWEGVVRRTTTRPSRETSRAAFARYAQDFVLDSAVHGALNLSTDYPGQTIEVVDNASPFKAGDVIEHSEYGRCLATIGRFGARERVHFTAADGRRYPTALVLARGTYRWLVRG